jgi:hypothetical protein
MKVLVATKETQGRRRNDFCWAKEGELLKFAFECDGESIDGKCGCRRSMTGVESHKGTTTMKVAELGITMKGYVELIKDAYLKGGWFEDDPKTLQETAETDAKIIAEQAEFFGLGAIIEKRGNQLIERI